MWCLAAGVAQADTAPSNDTLPTISGIAQQGAQLSADPGTWSGDLPMSFTYLWSDGQTDPTITLTAADVGEVMTVTVTATNATGAASATSDSLGPVLRAAPVSGGAPVISGIAQQGDTLTVSNGTWDNDPTAFGYTWEDCDSSGNNCLPITGATSSSYTLAASDVGSTIVAVVTASNLGGSAPAESASVGPVLPPAPVNSGGAPVISGTTQQGNTLSVTNGTWSNNPTTFNYVWEDCNGSGNNCLPIAGATSSSYTLAASDVGSTIVAVVTASNLGGSAPAESASVGPVLPPAPVNSGGAPVISGTAQQGNTLSVTNGTWSNSPTAFGYAWEDCDSSGNNCSPIAGAISSSYRLAGTDVGSTIVAVVTASNSGGPGSAGSGPVGPVLPAAPVKGGAPVIGGTAQQGNTLSVTNGTWSNSPTAFGYAWEDCNGSGNNCSPIAGATSSSYTLAASDVGSTIVAVVTASNSGGSTPATSANVVGPVLPAAPVDTTAPGITGTAQQGATLTANTGFWSNNPTRFTYVWDDCASSGSGCSAISGATASTYKPSASDVGKYVSVTVTASNSGGHNQVISASVGPVLPPAPVNTTAPVLTGTAEQGDTIKVGNGSWSNSTAFSYAWADCSNTTCSPIAGATSSSYTLSAADVGSTIICVVTATGPGGSTSANSNKSAVVAAAPTPPASQPTTTAVLASPTTAVTNQSVTLIATVTSSRSSSTALWGAVTFENGGAAIGGCANMPVTPSGQSATVACTASFAASSPQLAAIFNPAAGSILKGSVSPVNAIAVGPDSTSTSVQVSNPVTVGASTTFTATVAPPAARLGPAEPTGSVEFLDGAQPIGSCASQPLANGQTTCTVTYPAAGSHAITARYGGDANFTGSSSPTDPVSVAPVPTNVIGTITSTMQWAFYYTPGFTKVRNLVVNGVSPGATVLVRCSGKGCPFAHRATVLTKRAQCGRKTKGMCLTLGSFEITPGFQSHKLRVGVRITVEIVRPSWVGKFYRFTVRSKRGPRIQIGCLAPGGSVPGAGC